jgi:hypothetical protein
MGVEVEHLAGRSRTTIRLFGDYSLIFCYVPCETQHDLITAKELQDGEVYM